jgi:NADH-quinone oxidoreductase subunit L
VQGALIGVAVAIGFSGLALAAWLYGGDGARAKALGERFAGLHRWLANKYYVDELYEAVLGRPLTWISDRVLLGLGDRTLIDGTLHLLAATARGAAGAFGTLQSGSLQRYALYVVLGLLGALAWSLRHV